MKYEDIKNKAVLVTYTKIAECGTDTILRTLIIHDVYASGNVSVGDAFCDEDMGEFRFYAESGKPIFDSIVSAEKFIHKDSGINRADIYGLLDRIDCEDDFAINNISDRFYVRASMCEVPRISIEKTIENSNLTNWQKSVICVDGVSLLKNGSLLLSCTSSNIVYHNNTRDIIGEIIAKSLRAESGDESINVKWNWDDYSADHASMSMYITAKSKDSVKKAIAGVFGVEEAKRIVFKEEGYRNEADYVTASFTITERCD